MKSWNPEKILILMRQCGNIALQYYDAPPCELKGDKSIVTVADKAIETFLTQELANPENGSFLIGEETVNSKDEAYLQQALQDTAWIVDPIDGTAPYSAHFPMWGVSIAMAEKGNITNGAIYLPVENCCLITRGDKLMYCDDVANSTVLKEFIPKSNPLGLNGIVAISQYAAKNGTLTLSNSVFTWCACVAVCFYLLRGRFLGFLATIKLWDIAAIIAILSRTDFVINTLDGSQISNNIAENFHLKAFDSKRWMIKDELIIAADTNAANYVVDNYKCSGFKNTVS